MSWEMPKLTVGDRVLFYDNPFSASSEPQFGFVSSRPGKETIQILVFTASSGFVEKMSVRHMDDPFWKNSDMAQKWQVWGAWKLHPELQVIKEIKEVLDRKTKVPAKEASAA